MKEARATEKSSARIEGDAEEDYREIMLEKDERTAGHPQLTSR